MVEDKRIGWLRELLVGDRVCVSSRGNNLYGYSVTKITPSGRIVIGNSRGSSITFTASGTILGGSGSVDSSRLYPYDLEEHRAFLSEKRKKRLLEDIREVINDLDKATADDSINSKLQIIVSELTKIRDNSLKNN